MKITNPTHKFKVSMFDHFETKTFVFVAFIFLLLVNPSFAWNQINSVTGVTNYNGTNYEYFGIDMDGAAPIKLYNDAGTLKVRNNANSAYVDVKFKDLILDHVGASADSSSITLSADDAGVDDTWQITSKHDASIPYLLLDNKSGIHGAVKINSATNGSAVLDFQENNNTMLEVGYTAASNFAYFQNITAPTALFKMTDVGAVELTSASGEDITLTPGGTAQVVLSKTKITGEVDFSGGSSQSIVINHSGTTASSGYLYFGASNSSTTQDFRLQAINHASAPYLNYTLPTGGYVNIPNLQTGNLNLQSNTLSSTDTNGDVSLDPNGIGNVNIVSGNLEFNGVELQTPTQNLSANLLNKAKGDVISSIYSIVGATNIKGLWLFDQYGASTAVTDRGLLAHNITLSANGSTLTPGIAGLKRYTTFTGTEDFTIDDNNDFSFGDGSTDTSFSTLVLIKPVAHSGIFLLAKDQQITGTVNREWGFWQDGSYKLNYYNFDQSASADISIRSNSTYNGSGYWQTYCTTYDGSSLASGMKLYANGVVVASTDISSGSYTAMENGVATIGNYYKNSAGTKLSMSKGQMGLSLIVAGELTAAQVKQLDVLLRSYSGVEL
jgi:hypothetical protein